jgi:catechol 2,3-dioxygenase-like lactoylglutathione lyase family enzyme
MTIPPTAAPPIEAFHHIALPVHDLDSAEQFYVALLGATLVRKCNREMALRRHSVRPLPAGDDNDSGHLAVRFLDGPELHLFLEKDRGKPLPTPHPHLAMSVDSDQLEVFVARLRAADVPIDGPRRLGPPGHASVYFADPSGNTLELVTTNYLGPVLEGPPDVSKLGW